MRSKCKAMKKKNRCDEWMNGTRTNIYHWNIFCFLQVRETVYVSVFFSLILAGFCCCFNVMSKFYIHFYPLTSRFHSFFDSSSEISSHSMIFGSAFETFVFTSFLSRRWHCCPLHHHHSNLQYIYLLCSMGWIIARHSFRIALPDIIIILVCMNQISQFCLLFSTQKIFVRFFFRLHFNIWWKFEHDIIFGGNAGGSNAANKRQNWIQCIIHSVRLKQSKFQTHTHKSRDLLTHSMFPDPPIEPCFECVMRTSKVKKREREKIYEANEKVYRSC